MHTWCGCVIACTWICIRERLFMVVTCHFMCMWMCTPTRVRASDLGRTMHVTCNTILWMRFSCIEEFSKLPCPTCPPCQTYILVGFICDTFVDTVTCPVSKIRLCIRYDGWITKLGMCEVNIRNVRFVWNAVPIKFMCIWSIVLFSSLCDRICVHHDSHMCAMCDVCNISHDFVTVISIRRRVFDFTVSSVSNVSTLYFSRA